MQRRPPHPRCECRANDDRPGSSEQRLSVLSSVSIRPAAPSTSPSSRATWLPATNRSSGSREGARLLSSAQYVRQKSQADLDFRHPDKAKPAPEIQREKRPWVFSPLAAAPAFAGFTRDGVLKLHKGRVALGSIECLASSPGLTRADKSDVSTHRVYGLRWDPE